MRKLYLIGLLLMSTVGVAQRSVYTLRQYTPLLINPASPTLNYDAEVSMFHEEVGIATGEYLTTNSFNGDYVFVQKTTGRKWIGIGLNALERDAGKSDLLKRYEAGLTVATPVRLTVHQSLHFGMNATYVSTRTSMEHLSTGSQWIASEFRYDPSAGLGESFEVQNVTYTSLSTGLIWALEKDGQQHSSVGLAIWDVNRPNQSFFDSEARTPLTYQLHGQTKLYENHRVALSPAFYYLRSGSVNSYVAALSAKLLFQNENPYDLLRSGNVDLVARYGFNRDASVGVVLNQPGFSAGVAYNFPLGNENQYLRGGLQVGITLSRALWKPRPQKITIEAVPARRSFDFETQKTVVQQTEVDQIRSELEAVDQVKALQFELSKDFRFAFGKADLGTESEPFLDEVYQLLSENPNWQLQIIGHTDNVGSKHANYELSVARAQSVADYLIRKGFDAGQLVVTGRGDTEPVADNATPEGKARNRRVQFLINVANEE